MIRFVALLRAVNVGGARAVPMAHLKTALEAAGLFDVRTYLQSGNVVFSADEPDALAHASVIAACLLREFGHEVGVLVLPCDAVQRIAASNPFVSAGGVDEKWLHVTFLAEPVARATLAAMVLPAAPGESAIGGGGVVYLCLPHGYGRTKLNNAYFEKTLKTSATTRNWRTVTTLAELCRG